MSRETIEPLTLDTLTKAKYIHLLAKGYRAKDVFKSLSKGIGGKEKEKLREEFDYWRTLNGIKDLKPVRPTMKTNIKYEKK
ncbi:hypothetical protein [Enterococcus thailandicus]|uniref:hypothetical protein n=1 Tax=Enterococcus thailandicus TaxID=417368 RepID=UPI0035DB9A13